MYFFVSFSPVIYLVYLSLYRSGVHSERVLRVERVSLCLHVDRPCRFRVSTPDRQQTRLRPLRYTDGLPHLEHLLRLTLVLVLIVSLRSETSPGSHYPLVVKERWSRVRTPPPSIKGCLEMWTSYSLRLLDMGYRLTVGTWGGKTSRGNRDSTSPVTHIKRSQLLHRVGGWDWVLDRTRK